MANNNQVPSSVLPLAPLEYDVQHQNAVMRSLNFTLQQIQNPGHARMVDIVMTQCPTKPVRDNGTSYPDGTVWSDSGFLKLLPDGNPGSINADAVNCNTVNAVTSVTTPDVEATVKVDTATLNATTAVNTPVVSATTSVTTPTLNATLVDAGTVSAGTVSATTEVDTATVNATTVNATTVSADTVSATTSVDTATVNATTVNATAVDTSAVNATNIGSATVNVSGAYYVASTQVVTNQQPAIPNATNINNITGLANLSTGYVLASTSSNIVTVVNDILAALRAHGLIAP